MNKIIHVKMSRKAAPGFLLMLFFVQATCTTPASVGGSLSIPTSIGPTCGVGSNACPTDPTLEASQEPVTLIVPTAPAFPNTSAPEEDTTLTAPETTAAAKPVQTTTPKQQKSPSTTPMPPAKSPPTSKLPEQQASAGFAPSGTCACDLTAYSCDINCCCDLECTNSQRSAFSWCKVAGYTRYDNRYCYASKLIFLNNSEHVLEQAQSGAFCIVRSNLAASVLHPSHTTFTTHEEFVKHWRQSHSSVWPDTEMSSLQVPSIEKPKLYTAGSPLWIFQDNQIQSLEFPSSGLTQACSSKKTIQYLLPWSSKCMQQPPDSRASCESVSSDFHHIFQRIVRSPILLNQTQLMSTQNEPCPTNVCIPVTYFICSGSSLGENYANNCRNISSKKVLFGPKNGVCHGVIKKLMLTFHHNGTEGIEDAIVFMWLSNMSLSSSDSKVATPLHQAFTVNFLWKAPNKTLDLPTKANTNFSSGIDHVPFPRSGNPGYLVGKPVLAGFKVKPEPSANASKESNKDTGNTIKKQDMILLSKDPNQWLTLPGLNSNGMCDLSASERHVVTFGEDLHMSCGITLSRRNISSLSSCSALRSKMLHLLLGDANKSLYNSSLQPDWGRVIAAFGSANVSKPQDWVPLLLDYQPTFVLPPLVPESTNHKVANEEDALEAPEDSVVQTCENVPLGVQLQIMHGRVGTTSNPQPKIFGAVLRLSPIQDIGLACTSGPCFKNNEVLKFRVVSTVKFVDVTSPAVTRFAEPPAIHIRLPPDFFYPFMATEDSSAAQMFSSSLRVVLSVSIVLFVS